MISGRELEVWQNGEQLIIRSRYTGDPPFTIAQERALYETAKSFLLVNRQTERRNRYRRKRKTKESE